MDALIDAVTGFFGFIWMLLVALWPAIKALLEFIWWLLETYPAFRVVVVVGATAFFIYWFADGVKNWRKKCIPCWGKGAFNSKLSTKLNRPCDCCANDRGGAGRHPTIRSRIWDKMRGTKH